MRSIPIRLAIDIGAATTKAATNTAGRVVEVTFGGDATLPSGVWVHHDASLTVLPPADHTGHWLADPMSRLGNTTVDTPAGPVDPVNAVATLLRHVAETTHSPVHHLTLITPAGWGPRRLALLTQAATQAGLPVPEFVPAPIAAASHAHTTTKITPSRCVLTCDIGASTTTIAIVQRNTDDTWQVLAIQQPDHCDGATLDDTITTLVLDRAGAPHILRPELAEQVRLAIRTLTANTAGERVAIALPEPYPPIVLTQTDLREATAHARHTVLAAANTAIDAADISPDTVAATIIVGGAAAALHLEEELQQRYVQTLIVGQPADRILPAAVVAHTTTRPTAPATPNPIAQLGSGRQRIWRLVALVFPFAASWLLIWQAISNGIALLGRHGEHRYDMLSIFFSRTEYAIACLFTIVGFIAVGQIAAHALLEYAHVDGDPAGYARRAGRTIASTAAIGFALTYLYVQFTDTILSPPLWAAPYNDNALIASTIVAALAIIIGLITPLLPTMGDQLWTRHLQMPVIPIAMASLGILAINDAAYPAHSALEGLMPLVAQELVFHRGGSMLLGVAIAWTITTNRWPRITLAILLGLGGAITYNPGTTALETAYLVTAVAWWIIQTGRILADAATPLRPRLTTWWRHATNQPDQAGP